MYFFAVLVIKIIVVVIKMVDLVVFLIELGRVVSILRVHIVGCWILKCVHLIVIMCLIIFIKNCRLTIWPSLILRKLIISIIYRMIIRHILLKIGSLRPILIIWRVLSGVNWSIWIINLLLTL